MNLHGLAGPMIAAVNPMIPSTLQISSGNVIAADGTQSAQFQKPAQTVVAQVQSLTFRDLQQLDHLNLQGIRVAIYLYGRVEGLIRSQNRGGDLITIPVGPRAGVYLVAMVLESWPDWVKVAATLQADATVKC